MKSFREISRFCEIAEAMAARSAQSDPEGKESSRLIPLEKAFLPLGDLYIRTARTVLLDFLDQYESVEASSYSLANCLIWRTSSNRSSLGLRS